MNRLPPPATTVEEYLYALVLEVQQLNVTLSAWLTLAQGMASYAPPASDDSVELREPGEKPKRKRG